MCNKKLIVGIMFIMALFLGTSTMSMVQGSTGISLTLSPLEASNPVGTTHTVIATATNDGAPLADVLVIFSIYSGPNSPFNGTGTTNASGQATLTYTDIGGAGVDKIRALLFIYKNQTYLSNIVKKEWVGTTTGFMTGEGDMFVKYDSNVISAATISSLSFKRVTYRFKLYCDKTKGKNILEINFGNGNRFHLEELESAKCYFNPTSDSNPPKLGFNTYEGHSIGIDIDHLGEIPVDYKDVTSDVSITCCGTGKKDIASIIIKDKNGITLLEMSGEGHHQVHKDNGIV